MKMKKRMKILTSVLALCVLAAVCINLGTTPASAYTYSSSHVTGNLVSTYTGEVKQDTVNIYEDFYLTPEDTARAGLGQLQIYATADYWRQACAKINANIALTYYNASGTQISQSKASVNKYYSTGGYKNTLTINYTNVPSGTTRIRLGIYSHNSLTYDMKVKNIKVYLKDETAPVYAVCAPVTAPAKYKMGTKIRYQVKFTEPVNVSNAGYLNFKVGSQEINSKSAYVSQSSDKTILYYDFALPETTTTGDNLSVTLTSISGLSVSDDAKNSVTVNKTLNQSNGFYVDNRPPGVTGITTSASSDAVYKAGEKLTFDVTFCENIWVSGNPSISLSNGKQAVYVKKTETDTNICSFEYVIGEGDDAANIAITGVDFSGIYDSVKNCATEAPDYNTSIYNDFMTGRNVSIDTKAPTVDFSETEQGWKKEHKAVLTPNDNIAGVKAIYAAWAVGDNVPVYPDAPNVDLSENLAVTPKSSGEYKLYIRITDNVDNTADYVSPYTYSVDVDAPVIKKEYTTEEGMVNKVLASAVDAHSGTESFTYRWINENNAEVLSGDVNEGIDKPTEDGVYTIILTAADKAGNAAEDSIESLAVDSAAPEVVFTPNENADYEKTHTTSVSVTDEKSGVKEYYYLWSDSAQKPDAENEKWTLANGNTFTTPENQSGTYYLHIKAIDKVENTAIVSSGGFNIDNIAPNISLTPNGNSDCVGEKSCDVRIEITDQISSSTDITAWYAISEDKASHGEMMPLTSEVITVDTVNAPKYLTVKAADKAGNEALIQSEAYMPDTAAPEGTISKTEDKYYINTNTVNVKISASDDYSSTILMQIKVDDAEGEWEEYETAKALVFDKIEGEHTVSVRFKDKSDNISDYESVAYCYDVTAPEISFDYLPSTLTKESVTVTATAIDDKSETKFTTERTKVFDVNGSFEFIAYDEAGNIARKTVKVDYIDKTKPTISITSDCFDGKKYRDAKVKIATSDENGIGKLEYAIIKNGEEPSTMTECRNGEEILIRGLDGAYQIAVRATDGVGNTDSASSQSILFDNTPPTATITYEPSKRTARDVVAAVTFNEDTVITNNGGKNTYTFTDNGEFTFEFKDDAGNIGSETAKVTWIDRSRPTAKVILNHDGWTSEDITVTLLPQPQSIIQNVRFNEAPIEDNELNTYTFSEYGILEYEIYDIETEISTEDSVIVKVDKDAPTVKEIHYSETEWTNKDVTVSIEAEDDLSEIEYVNGKTHTFSENGSHTFTVSDSAGNTTEKTVSVDFIDKDTPVPIITYYADGKVYDTATPTNKNVNAVVTFNSGGSPVSIVNNDGSFEHEFESNGKFKFMFTDEAGNTGEVEAVVSKIDKIAPTGYVTYSKSSWTNTDVVATLHTSDDVNEVTVTNNAKSENYTFTDNGEFVFEFKDTAGNTASAKAEVSIIDKKKPTLSYTLSTNDPTPFSVFAVVTADERVTFKNNDGKPSRQFTSNGEYKFEAADRAGNTAEINVVVTNISKETTPVKLVYSKTDPTNEDVFVTIEPQDGKSYIYVTNNNGQKTKRFTENGEFTFTYKNAIGIEGEATASVTNIDKEPPAVTISYSHDSVTNEDVTVTFNSTENVKYPYVVTGNKYIFTKNGKIQFPVKDEVGNVTNIIAETVLIDKNPPTIEVETPYEVIAVGDAIDVMQGVTVSDENELDGEIAVNGAVDTSQSGIYTVKYSVKDIAGNVGEAQKQITVYDPNEFNIFVNGQLAFGNQINLNGKQLDITATNVQGELAARYLPGKKAVGDFKTKGTEISLDGELPSVGYYTIYLRDDDRNARLVYVFIQE